MSDKTGIEWTDATWNPVWGCTKVSPGCDNCYAETLVNGRLAHLHEGGFGVVRLRPEQLDKPLHWKRPRRIFVNSMSDLFHDDIPDEYIARVFAVMALAPQHTFQVLTKRHGRMRSLLQGRDFEPTVREIARNMKYGYGMSNPLMNDENFQTWPLPNVWIGVSVENQQWADIRIPALLETPASVRFLSCEPLLGPVLLPLSWLHRAGHERRVDWIIAGGESGRASRPMHLDWVRTLRNQCQVTGTAFHFKQWGEWQPTASLAAGMATDPREQFGEVVEDGRYPDLEWHRIYRRVGKKAAGRELDGRTWDEWPEVAS